MVKRIIKTTIIGIGLSLLAIKVLLVFLSNALIDSVFRVISPLGLELTPIEFTQIIFTAIVTSIISYLIYTNKIPLKKYLG